MTQEYKEIIKDILSSPNRIRESYIINNYEYFHESVLLFVIKNKLPISISFKEKLWYYTNNIKEEKLCKICNGKVKFNRNFKDGYKDYCSSKCSQKNPETKLKRKETNIRKYGVDNVAKSNEIKEKTIKTNLERYGHKSSFQNTEVRKKWENSIKNSYGVDHIFKSNLVKEKIRETNNKRYGVDYFVQSDKYKKLLIENNHSNKMSEIYWNKTVLTNNKKYGTEHYFKSDEYIDIMTSDRMKEYLKEKNNEFWTNNFNNNFKNYEFIESYTKENSIEVYSKECNHLFKIKSETFYKRYKNGHNCCIICEPLNSLSQSSLEIEVGKFLNNIGIDYIPNYNNHGIEMDIFIPDKNLAIEINGLYWHSELKKHKNFHITKTNICNDNNIDLIHIWEDDWLYKRYIVESILLNRLGKISNRIYARKCKIREVSPKESSEFLNDNHIQGNSNAKIKLGLYYDNKLVSLMTFSERYINGIKQMELVRFCNLLNTNVVGGASKLFKYFINNYHKGKIKSYADVSMFSGALYNKLGFNYVHRSSPNYFWVVDGIRKHRFNYNKKKLVSQGHDPSMTEREIMESMGYFRIWGCGQDLYEFN